MNKTINLLPADFQKEKRPYLTIKKLKKLIIFVFLGAMLVSFIVFILMVISQRRYDSIQEKIRQIHPAQSRVALLQKENQELSAKIKALNEIKDKKFYVAPVLIDLENHIPENLWILEMKFQDNKKIVIQGAAADFSAVGVFVNNISELPCFIEVRLQKAEEIKSGELSITKFTIQGTLKKGSA